jgi:6-phosphogluconolactonase
LRAGRDLVFDTGMKPHGKFPKLLSLALAMASLSLVSTAAEKAQPAGKTLVYFGTYTGTKSKGIYVSQLDLATGMLSEPELAGEANKPSWVALHPNGKFLYAVDETDKLDGKIGGAVTAFAIAEGTGKLTRLNQQTSGGPGPCHVIVDAKGKALLVANYSGGSVESLPLTPDGKLGAPATFIKHEGSGLIPGRQAAAHAHGAYVDAGNNFVFVPDLGMDKVMIYKLDASTAKLTPNDPPSATLKPGSGPRHFAFGQRGRQAYVINEISCTVTAFDYDAKKGALTEIQTISTLPPGEAVKKGFSTAELDMHPNGRFLYGSNRGHDTIVVFAVDEKTGKLTYVENTATQGKTPRGFGVDPSGQYLVCGHQDSDNAGVFRIDQKTGKLTATGQLVELGKPVCVQFLER